MKFELSARMVKQNSRLSVWQLGHVLEVSAEDFVSNLRIVSTWKRRDQAPSSRVDLSSASLEQRP